MTLINLCGYETGSITNNIDTQVFGGTGDYSIQSIVKRTGNYALRTNPATTSGGYVVHKKIINSSATEGAINLANCWYRFYFRVALFPASNNEVFAEILNSSSAQKLELHITSDRKLQAYDSAGSQLGSDGTTILSADTWYRIEIKCGTGASAAYEVLVNGVIEFSGTGNLGVANNDALVLGKYENFNGNSVDFYFDDVAIDDTGYPGEGQTKALIPNADGNYTDFTIGAGSGDKWQQVADVPLDITDYLLSTLSANQAYTAALQSCADAGIFPSSINAVKAVAVVVRDGGANGTIAGRLRSATTDSDTGNASISQIVRGMMYFSATNPATGAAWTESGLNSCEVGAVEKETVDKTRLLACYLMVDYVPVAANIMEGWGVVF